VNPAQAGPRAGVPGETRIVSAVAGWFRELGGTVIESEPLPGRPMVCGLWSGESPRWAGLDVHVDTVGVEQMIGDPFSGELSGGKVWGRGAVDTKASLAVALALLDQAQRSGAPLGCNLLLAATPDEEVGAQGAPKFRDWVRAQGLELDQLAVAEPTLCGPVIGHKGGVRLEFEVLGEPAHSSQPHLGKNAITAAARLALALDEEHQRLQQVPPTTPLGAPTLTVTIVRGGTGTNVVPATCVLTVDRRMVPGEDGAVLAQQLSELAQKACPLPVETRAGLVFDSFYQPAETPWIRQLADWSGKEPSVVPYGTNAWAYKGLARETVVIGPGSIAQAHGVEEWVEVSELEKLAGIFARWWGLADES
jgi:acetylornithine deacetylase/succinyl-diaminopimelate desuccinylase-like protein